MKYITSLVTITCCTLFPIFGCQAADGFSPDSLRHHVSILADDSLEGRQAGWPGARMAERYIVAMFESAGLTPGGNSGTFLQAFPIPDNPQLLPSGEVLPGSITENQSGVEHNVIGRLRGNTDTTIILGAHYDHIGWGAMGSRQTDQEPRIHPGADDNASGVAVLIELARYFAARQDMLRYSLEFLAFSAEEIGGVGSQFYVNDSSLDAGKVRLLANMDMVGRLRNDEKGLIVFGGHTSPPLARYLDTVYAGDMQVSLSALTIGSSDHMWFHKHQIPAVTFFTGVHDEYNSPDDKAATINYDGAARVAEFVAEFVEYFDQLDEELPYEKKGAAAVRKPHGRASVSLGITPDFVSDVKGLRIDAVSEGKPAERAGLKPGDIIVKIGDKAIGNIYEYMGALKGYQEGDATVVTVNRAGELVSIEVQF